jgi:hypothetical protein
LGLTIDGLPVTQAEFDRRMGSGSAGIQISIGGRPTFFVTNHLRLRHLSFVVLEVDRELEDQPERVWVERGYPKGILDISLTDPQNPKKIPFVRLPLINHKKLLQETLAYSDCNDFMSQLISKAGELLDGKNDPVSTDIMTLYGMVNGQARGGFRLNHDGPLYGYLFNGLERLTQIAAGGGASWGDWGASNVTIWINEQNKAENASAREIARTPFEYAQRSLEELVHVAGKNRTYRESEIVAAADALEPGLTFIQAIKKHCIPREMW